MTCSHMSYFFISKQLLWELFFRISNSKAAALIGTARQKDITEIPINGALKFALVFCGNNMYFANTNSSGTQAFVRAVSAPEKTVTCTTIQNKLIIQNNDENTKAYMCKIF